MKYRYLAAALAVFSTSAQAANWREAGGTDEYPAVIAYVDTDSLSRNGNQARFAIRMYQEGTTNSDALWSQIWSVNCATTAITVESSSYYLGIALQEQSSTPAAPFTPVAQSVDLNIVSSACGNVAYQSGTIADPGQDAADLFDDLAYEDW